MFTVTLHYDLSPSLEPSVVRRCASYQEAYEYARSAARSQSIQPSAYVKRTHDDETWLDGFEARLYSYSALNPDLLLAHTTITCDDLEVWHAAVLATPSQSVWEVA